MALTPAGKAKLWAYGFVIVLDIVVLALSVSVNVFQEFFFVADLLPLFLSIATLAILLTQIAFELTSQNPLTSRPVFEIPLMGALTIFWLVINSFSTSRWKGLPNCSVFSEDDPDERVWCRNMQGLRAIVWIQWTVLFLTTLKLTRVSIVQARRGNTAVWHMALFRRNSNSNEQDSTPDTSSFYRGSSIFGFDKLNGHQKNLSMTSRDWFAPAEPTIGTGSKPVVVPDPAATRTVDGFEIVTGGYYPQNGGAWDQSGIQYRS